MPIRIREQLTSRDGTDATDQGSTAELKWLVYGTSDVVAAEAALLPFVPAIFVGLVFKSLSREQQSRTAWMFTASYSDPKKQEEQEELDEGEFRFGFDSTGGTLHITVNPNGTDPFGNAPSVGGAINVDFDNQPQGVDITVPSMIYKLTYRFPDDHFVDFSAFLDYCTTVEELTGTTNNATVLKRAAGEMLFLGGTGDWSTKSGPQIDYSFAVSKNLTGLTIGNIPGINKKGHAYLWVAFERTTDPAAKVAIPKPRGVYVENLYKSADWTALNIPAV